VVELRKFFKKVEKVLMTARFGVIIWIAIGLLTLLFLLRSKSLSLYLLVILGTPILFYLKSQDWLPYIYGGIFLALIVQRLLGLLLSTSMPVVAIVSSSMDHGISSTYPCGVMVANYTENFDNWWELCKHTYEKFNITKEDFAKFPFRDGLKIGDMPIVQGSDTYKVGDIIVYDAGQPAPIIHRIVKINEDGTYQTKGDHNPWQNPYEYSVKKEQIYGKVIFVIPKLGYFKVLSSMIGV
jgi:signal peptidase I